MARILLVEDDKVVRSALRRLIVISGHEPLPVAEGFSALALYRDNPCDLVITDVKMPGKGGVQFIDELLAEFADARVIGLSGAGPEILQSVKDAGAIDALEKPVETDHLKMVIEKALQGS